MKKWQERTIFILGLGVVGIIALAIRPALQSDSVENISLPESLKTKLSQQYDLDSSFSCNYAWDFSNHATHTVLLGDIHPSAFSLLQKANWNIHIEARDGELKISHDTPVLHAEEKMSQVKTNYLVEIVQPRLFRMMPNGQLHTEYNIFLLCEVIYSPSFFKKPLHTFAAQNLKIDLMDGCVDVTTPTYISPKLLTQLPQHNIEQGSTPDLPSRYCGSPAERLFTQILYDFCDIRSPFSVDAQVTQLWGLAEKATQSFVDSTKPWPACWGDDAELVQRLSTRVVPALIRMQQQECYKSKKLADFINSPTFALLFGESFKDAMPPDERAQVEPIKFRELPVGEIQNEENQTK